LIEVIEHSSPHYRIRNLAMVKVLFFCGLRVSEVTRLKTTHIDWANSLFVNLRIKRGKSIDVHFPPGVGEALKACIADRARFHLASHEQACFLSDRGKQISVRQLQGILAGLGKAAEIHRPVSPHVLRHTSATELARRGLSMFALKEFLAHEKIEDTQRYVHLVDEIKPAVNAMEVSFDTRLATRYAQKAELPPASAPHSA
jgi:integrase/recombinase XerD